MGWFSAGNSKTTSTTNNNDNRTINDYTGSTFDNSTDNGIDGNLNNNTGTINMLDGGAFDLVGRANDNAVLLGDSAISAGRGMLDSGLSYGQSLFSESVSLADNISSRGLDAALSVHDSALSQVSAGNELAFSLAQLSNGASLEAQQDNNNALENGFKSMMQFAEGFSRSDGSQLASSNLKLIGIVAAAGVAIAFFVRSK